MNTTSSDRAASESQDGQNATASRGVPEGSPTIMSSPAPFAEIASHPKTGGGLSRAAAWLGLVVAIGACVLVVLAWQRSEKLTREAARRWQEAELRLNSAEQQLKQTQELMRESGGRSALLESKVAEVVAQQAQLERMYRNIAQNSLDVVLADVENSVSIAAQQLLVGANVQGAMLALQDADTILKRVDQATVSPLRRLLARDVERLKALPTVDVSSMAARLDAVAAVVDQLPLLSGPAPTEPAAGAAQAGESAGTIARFAESGLRGWNAFKQELLSLVRVTRVDSPDALLLAPSQQYFVRENLRLTLMSARFALLSRNEAAFRVDLERAVQWLTDYYDRQARPVQTASQTLRQLQANKLALELPSLAESLAAIRAQRSTREGRP